MFLYFYKLIMKIMMNIFLKLLWEFFQLHFPKILPEVSPTILPDVALVIHVEVSCRSRSYNTSSFFRTTPRNFVSSSSEILPAIHAGVSPSNSQELNMLLGRIFGNIFFSGDDFGALLKTASVIPLDNPLEISTNIP